MLVNLIFLLIFSAKAKKIVIERMAIMKNIIKKIVALSMAVVSALTISSSLAKNDNNKLVASAASYETAYLPGDNLNVTKGAYNQFNGYSHGSQNAFDLGGNNNYVAPFTGKIVSIYDKYNVVTLQSTNKVYYADGTLDYMTVSFVHDNDISDLWEGKVIKQGTVFYQEGSKDPTGKSGVHVHIAVKRGRINNYFFSGDVYPNDAFWLKSSTNIQQRGGYAWASKGSTTSLVNGGVYTISPNGKNLYLAEVGTKNLANVNLSSKVNSSSKWRAYHTNSGWYFQNLASGKVLDIYGQSVKSGSNIQIYTYNKCATEYFTLKPNGRGAFIIQSTNKRVAVDCCGSSSTLKNGSNVWCYSINYDATQLFRFNRVG